MWWHDYSKQSTTHLYVYLFNTQYNRPGVVYGPLQTYNFFWNCYSWGGPPWEKVLGQLGHLYLRARQDKFSIEKTCVRCIILPMRLRLLLWPISYKLRYVRNTVPKVKSGLSGTWAETDKSTPRCTWQTGRVPCTGTLHKSWFILQHTFTKFQFLCGLGWGLNISRLSQCALPLSIVIKMRLLIRQSKSQHALHGLKRKMKTLSDILCHRTGETDR